MMLSFLILASLTSLSANDDARLRVEVQDAPTDVRVVAKLPSELLAATPQGQVEASVARGILSLSIIDEEGQAGAAIFGKYERQGDLLIFVPRYGLAHGQLYQARFAVSPEREITTEYEVPARKPTEPPRVLRIDPGSDVVPANLLKFYLHFSKPMREGRRIFELLQLLDEEGNSIPDPWRRTELWTADTRRFTLWIHPGRVKQGVNLHEEEGPVLLPGRKYTLVVGGQIRDADGQPLGKAVTKRFRTVAADRTRPLPQQWRLHSPAIRSRKPLQIQFGEPLDHAMLLRLITVTRGGSVVTGDIETAASDATWIFRPSEPWSDAEYQINVNPLLEDLAGNTPDRVFDKDLFKPDAADAELTRRFRPSAE